MSTARHRYGGQSIVANQIFYVDNEQDAEDLIALNLAVRDESEPKPRRTYRRRDMKAEN